MNAKFRGLSFATRASEPDDSSPVTQAYEDEMPADGTIKRKITGRRERSNEGRLSAIAKNQLSTSGLLELIEPQHGAADLILSPENYKTLSDVVDEVRRGEEIRRHGLSPRSKLLFCGPPGCGKTLCAEVIAGELRLPLLVARLDGIITTYLGETASNLRKVFETISQLPAVLFLDEFDALARARTDAMEHNEIRRVVNSLLMMIDRFSGKGVLIAATNLDSSIDHAAWRRFDEIVLFERPTIHQIKSTLRLKLRNYPIQFEASVYAERLEGMSFAEIERVCVSSIRASILSREASVPASFFERAIDAENRRIKIRQRVRD
jgi:SpoVK/Ycf46/Vps4 family AAA+-type ATPase